MSHLVQSSSDSKDVTLIVAKAINTSSKLNRRHLQAKQNNVFKQGEQELDSEIKQAFQQNGLELSNLSVVHVGKKLTRSLSGVKSIPIKYKALTLIVANFENHPQTLVSFSACLQEDNFSRLEGRFYAKRRMLSSIRTSLPKPVKDVVGNVTGHSPKDITCGLAVFPLSDKAPEGWKPNLKQIANWYIKNVFAPVVKPTVDMHPLSSVLEKDLHEVVLTSFAQKEGLLLNSFKSYSVNVRPYSCKYFSNNLATVKWFNENKEEGDLLSEKGGYTVYALTADKADNSGSVIIITTSICNSKDTFSSSLGRKQCLMNMIQNQNTFVFSNNEPVDSISDSLVEFLESHLKRAINIKVG